MIFCAQISAGRELLRQFHALVHIFGGNFDALVHALQYNFAGETENVRSNVVNCQIVQSKRCTIHRRTKPFSPLCTS
jgi:hypothetical protein